MRTKNILSINSLQIAEIGILIPVYNQEMNIIKVLDNLMLNVKHRSDLVILDDCSSDNTVQIISDYIESNEIQFRTKFNKIKLIKNKKSYFETRCDYYGIEVLRNRFIIEIQSDMIITEPYFDDKMVQALSSHPDIFAISGRGTEQLFPVIKIYESSLGSDRSFSKNLWHHVVNRMFFQLKKFFKQFIKWNEIKLENSLNNENVKEVNFNDDSTFLLNGVAGRLGDLINNNQDAVSLSDHKIYLGQTIMRGPLIIDSKKYFELGGFNIDYFFQGFVDHELFVTAWLTKKYRVGYVPIGFLSPLSIGTGRKPRSLKTEISIFLNLFRIRKFKGRTLLSTASSLDENELPCPQIRIF
jgi:glycosyltransferase involved in cell wall biosynthesis